MRIEIPEFALVALVGTTSSGKSTFAAKHFLPTEVLSSDVCRGIVSDDCNDQSATEDAFDLLYYAAQKRLSRMKTTVIDATNVQQSARKRILSLAREQHVHSVAIVLNLPEKTLLERNAADPGRGYPERVIRQHVQQLRKSIRSLKKEGFRFVYVLDSQEAIDQAEVIRTKLWNNKRELHGPFDIIGDVHGCLAELKLLLDQLGYLPDPDGIYVHPQGRMAAFLGDLCDRGAENTGVLRLVMGMISKGTALSVPGNHDVKLLKYLQGRRVQLTHGLEITAAQLDGESDAFRSQVQQFLEGLVSHYVLDGGKLVIAHAGIKEKYIGRGSGRIRDFCLYGDVNGETDAYGLPVRGNWAEDYRGKALVVYGHVPGEQVRWENHTCCIDTGCVFGGMLTALRYPEQETISVPALQQYAKPLRALQPEPVEPGTDTLMVQDVQGRMQLTTGLIPSIVIGEAQAAAALEAMSRYAADPKWLIYLPPTMSPCKTSQLPEYLEHPLEAFSYYREHGIRQVICEKKHMGSRAVIVLCRNAETASRRFGVEDGTRGIIYTRTGRRFFEDVQMEQAVLDRLDAVLMKTGLWKDFATDWVCLDTELMPWSEKAQTLLQRQYAPVGVAGRNGLAAAVDALEQTCRRQNHAFRVDPQTSGQNADPRALLEQYREKQDALCRYTTAYREYCWQVNSVEDLKIAPFHLLACEGHVFSDRTNLWHMETLKQYCTGVDPIFIATDYLQVDTEDPDSIQAGVDWWVALTGSGGEGMVVKPEPFTAMQEHTLLQPAVKCRGAEYLRIIYGPEYRTPAHLERLKKRSLSRKRSLALREFALGMESLNRFVAKEPLHQVHACVFGVLALESEPVDPRL